MKKRATLLLLAAFLPSCGRKASFSTASPSSSSSSSLVSPSAESSASPLPSSSSSTTLPSPSSSLPSPSSTSSTSSEDPLSSSSTSPVHPSSSVESLYQSLDYTLYGAAFLRQLSTLCKSLKKKTVSYSSTLSIGAKAASYPDENSSTFIPFYHAVPDTASLGACNREHVWPNSRGAGKSGPGSDPFIIRPSLKSDNSSRGNNFYGYSSDVRCYDPKSAAGYEAARGEAARVILYAATYYYDYGSPGFSLSNNAQDSTKKHTMGRLDRLLEWNEAYPPSAMERQINDALYNYGGSPKTGFGRNPYVDHPELANYIWTKDGLRTAPYRKEECEKKDVVPSFSSFLFLPEQRKRRVL